MLLFSDLLDNWKQ